MPGSMTDGDPRNLGKPELRFFTIPGNSSTEWDPEVHGVELDPEDPNNAAASGDVAEVCWIPGSYNYVAGASGNEYTFLVPEGRDQRHPQQDVMRAIHKFLAEVDL